MTPGSAQGSGRRRPDELGLHLHAPSLGGLSEERTRELQSLQAHRVRRILLVASLYDSFTLSEGQHLTELLIGAYHHLALADPPIIDRVATRSAALERLQGHNYDMLITLANTGPMPLATFGHLAAKRAPETPIFHVASSPAELDGDSEAGITRAFLWRGDVRLLATIIKLAEDAANARRDARIAGVRTILLVEDGIPFYSTYLPMLFSEVTRQTDRLISQGVNTGQRLLRRRLRPRIVHATTFEEAWRLYSEFAATLLCVISDVRFPREGDLDAHAGIRLLRAVRDDNPEIPLLLQSSQPSAAMEAAALGATFVNKDSPTLLHDFHAFMLRNLGFGDFVFRQPDGSEVGRAHDVPSMLEALASVPDESLRHHALRNHFSNWLMARTEFALASNLRKRHVADFPSVDAMREFLCATFTGVMAEAGRGQVVDFDRDRVGPPNPFVRIGGGSLGGKGRGLAFMHALLGQGNLTSQSDALSYQVPESAVIGTEVFERFLDDNELVEFALCEESDARILEAFQAADLPAETEKDLEAYLGDADFPLAVRSSSLLEDSRHFPAAGIYPTHMLPNTGPLPDRLARLLSAIKHVYASSFFSNARAYLAGAPGRVEDERMAVVLQRLAGRRHGRYLYPDISGVARSYNVYPVDDMPAEEGVVVAALGLGRTVVEGGRAIRFSPGRPRIPPHLTTPEDIVEHAQREFWALDLTRWPDTSKPAREDNLELLGLEAAREHGTLAAVASVYSNANNRVYRGLSREGVPLVTLAPLLRRGGFPLAEALRALLELGEAGLAGPVEIEFAVVLDPSTTGRGTVAFLQIRPMATGATEATVDIGSTVPEDLFVGPCRALGAGVITGLSDIVVVRRDTFDRAQTPAIARQVGEMNLALGKRRRHFLLIGPGRWGTADRWLGIPVAWTQISNARLMVETRLDDIEVEPSDGAHFFHNVTSRGIGYYTTYVTPAEAGSRRREAVDWEWLAGQPVVAETEFVRHLRLERPMEARIDGRRALGVIRKHHTRENLSGPETATRTRVSAPASS